MVENDLSEYLIALENSLPFKGLELTAQVLQGTLQLLGKLLFVSNDININTNNTITCTVEPLIKDTLNKVHNCGLYIQDHGNVILTLSLKLHQN